MSLVDKITSLIPFGKPPQEAEYFFALNISPSKVTASLWTVEGGRFKVINPVSGDYSSSEVLIDVSDRLLDLALADYPFEPTKILFGVPDSWLLDDDLKEPYLKLLRNLVKSLDIKPMAYVASSHALTHLLEKIDGVPTTAILIGIETEDVLVTVVRAGKLDGTKVVKRGQILGEDIEKALMSFTEVEVLPSRMLLYDPSNGMDLEKQKSNLLSFPWMNRLSFLHFPKIEILEENLVVSAVALAGAVEIFPDVRFVPGIESNTTKPVMVTEKFEEEEEVKEFQPKADNLGFVTGDVMDEKTAEDYEEKEDREERSVAPPPTAPVVSKAPPFLELITTLRARWPLFIPVIILAALILAYLFLSRAQVIIFVEPKTLEKDTQVTADPTLKNIDEENKRIPGTIVETEVSGSEKASATGKKDIGENARGSVVIYNATSGPLSFKSGTILVADSGEKFTLNNNVSIASKSASAASPPTKSESTGATAQSIGPDGNIPSDVELKVGSFQKSEVVAKSEGNFSGGTSKEVTVVTDSDQKKLLATLASNLRKQAQEKLQGKLQDKKILEEGLTEEIVKRSYNKNVNDQANEFSLNLTVRYKGIAYSEADLKTIVSKLVETNVDEGFELNLAETETQADVSKVEKDKLIFLARFKAKLTPKIDEGEIKRKIRGKTPMEAAQILKSYENVLGSEIKINPPLPTPLSRLSFWEGNIKVEVKLK